MKMLIVDDSLTMRVMLGQLGRNMSFKTETANDGSEAISKLMQNSADEPFSLAVIDWEMPGMDGLEFIRAIRNKPDFKSLKLMMITSRNTLEEVSEALEAGADEFLMKPITRESFSSKLQILGLSPSTDAPAAVRQDPEGRWN